MSRRRKKYNPDDDLVEILKTLTSLSLELADLIKKIGVLREQVRELK